MIGMADVPATSPGPADEPIEKQLISALRVELEEYGALLRGYEAQHHALLERRVDLAEQAAAEIETQRQKARACRKRREALARTVAEAAGCTEETSLHELVPFFPPMVRPMIEALTDEVNRLINQTKRRARQNEALLARIS